MDENYRVESLRCLPERLQSRVVEIPSIDIRSDLRAAKAEPAHHSLQFGRAAHRILERDRCERDKALRKFGNSIAQAIIQPAGKFKRVCRRKPIEKIGTRWRQDLHIDTLLVHNRNTQVEIGELGFGLSKKRLAVA